MNHSPCPKSWLNRLGRRLRIDVLPTIGLLTGLALAMAWVNG